MKPSEPGLYVVTSPNLSTPLEMEVYLSKLGHLRARLVMAKKFRENPNFQGKKVNTFSEGLQWSRVN